MTPKVPYGEKLTMGLLAGFPKLIPEDDTFVYSLSGITDTINDIAFPPSVDIQNNQTLIASERYA